MNACQEILCRAALAWTLTQVPGIEYISIYSGDQPLLDKSGMPAGPISAADFVDSITDVNAYERTELTLYFTDANGTLLYPEKRSVMHNVNTSVERVIIEELIHQCLALTVSMQVSRAPPSAVSKIPTQVPDMLPFSMVKAQRQSGSQAVTVKFVA